MLSELEDIELMQLSSQKHPLAFEEIFNRYWNRLYAYAYKIYQDSHVCEDIVQEVFVSLWNKSNETPILHLEAYLFKSVKYQVGSHIKSLQFTTDQLEYIESLPDKIIDQLEYQELEAKMFNQIEELPSKCKEVFKLSRIEQKSNSEIAKSLNLSIRTVETHISNAIKLLRQNKGILKMVLLLQWMFL